MNPPTTPPRGPGGEPLAAGLVPHERVLGILEEVGAIEDEFPFGYCLFDVDGTLARVYVFILTTTCPRSR